MQFLRQPAHKGNLYHKKVYELQAFIQPFSSAIALLTYSVSHEKNHVISRHKPRPVLHLANRSDDLKKSALANSKALQIAPRFSSRTPKTTRLTRACAMAPIHITQGSNVTYKVLRSYALLQPIDL